MSATPETPLTSGNAGLLGGYRPAKDAYDEMTNAMGEPRAHWQKLVASLERLGGEELTARWENARRIIREHGVTYNVYGDPQGMDRPWELDMVPFLIPPSEWAGIDLGLQQRARLFNLILADLYGPQRLLKEGLLPPALLHANPGFLRPCHGIRPPRDLYLHLHAVDLARSVDGGWWVLADRTQAPSGSGYALENRIVLSRVLPDEFRDSQVQRLASFFAFKRDTLQALAPRGTESPHVVILTPGPHNETFFEQAYLARYLGFTLVEGGDLTVRQRRVFIKTLEGLQPVDVILRRVDDTFCDPLELKGDSFLGVAGLVDAARAGNVTIANSLGSGLLESPAFLAFLPGLCRLLLSEELKLPSVATWWCGQPRELAYVVEHLDEMVVKPAFGSLGRPPYFGGRLSQLERKRLIEELRARPHAYVGQERVALSSAPTWIDQGLKPRPVVLRAHTAAGADAKFHVMPGGLTRVSTAAEDPVVSMQSGGGSKDTWVLSEGPVSTISLLNPSGQPAGTNRRAAEVPSRVADNLFWMGRYSERLEGLLRLLRCLVTRLVDESSNDGSPELASLAGMMVRQGLLPLRFTGRVPLKDLEQEILPLIYNQNRMGSVRSLLGQMRIIASIVRDRFSADTWRILNQLQLDSRSKPGRIPLANALSVLNTLIVDLAAFSGMEMENMTRGHAWLFLDSGRRIERGTHLTDLLRSCLMTDAPMTSTLEPILEIADSAMTYRRRYFAHIQLPCVLELLVQDITNPRSIAFQLQALCRHATELPGENTSIHTELEGTAHLEKVMLLLRGTDLQTLCMEHAVEKYRPLERWLKQVEDGLYVISDQLTHRFFSHTVARVS